MPRFLKKYKFPIPSKKGADQYYVNVPTAVAMAMDLKKGETIEWFVEDKANIIAHRPSVPPNPVAVKKPSPLLNQWEAQWNAAATGGHSPGDFQCPDIRGGRGCRSCP